MKHIAIVVTVLCLVACSLQEPVAAKQVRGHSGICHCTLASLSSNAALIAEHGFSSVLAKVDKDNAATMIAVWGGSGEAAQCPLPTDTGLHVDNRYIQAFEMGHQDMVWLFQVAEIPCEEATHEQVDRSHDDFHVHGEGKRSNTALHRAAREGHLEEVEHLLQTGLDVHAANAKGETALHLAAREGHVRIVELLLRAGADVNALNLAIYTVLMEAAYQGHTGVMKLLLEAGADVNAWSEGGMGETAVIRAVKGGHATAVQALIDAGADVDATAFEHGYSALMKASSSPLADTYMVQLLLQAGATVDLRDYSGSTALMWAAGWGHADIVQQLLEAGADVDAADENYETALMWAVGVGYAEVVQTLIDAGADVDAKAYEHGHTALMRASTSAVGDPYIVQLLLQAGATVDLRDYYDNTALMLAASRGHTDIVQQLLEAGADVDVVNENSETALALATQNGHDEVVYLVKAHILK